MEDSLLIITVPHAACGKREEHGEEHGIRICDEKALEAARMLYSFARDLEEGNTLNGHTPSHILYFENTSILREEHDLNRWNGRSNGFRPDLDSLLKQIQNSGRNALLIDVHSFPRDAEFGTSYEIVLMSSSATGYLELAPLLERLRKVGIRATWVRSRPWITDIENRALFYGVSVFLVEVFEEISPASLILAMWTLSRAL